ncbi:hypothetical protein KAJ77_00175 [bacterium]|nr:hypothetical protein [bacterium]
METAVSDIKPNESLEDIPSAPSLLFEGIIRISTETIEDSTIEYFLFIHGFIVRYSVSIGPPIFVVGLSTMFNSPSAVPATCLSVSRRSEFHHNG